MFLAVILISIALFHIILKGYEKRAKLTEIRLKENLCVELDSMGKIGFTTVPTKLINVDSLVFELEKYKMIEKIMMRESCVLKPYKAGEHMYVGFGHLIKRGEHFRKDFNFLNAYDLLLSDINGNMALCREIYPKQDKTLLDLTYASFCRGFYKVKRDLKKYL